MLKGIAGLVRPRAGWVGVPVTVVLLATTALLGTAHAAPSAIPMASDVIAPTHLIGAAQPDRPSVMVVGDSVPKELMDTISKEAKTRDLNVVPVSFGGCSVVGLYQLDEANLPFIWSARCTKVPAVQTAAIKAFKPQLVVWYSGREKFTVCTRPTKAGCASPDKLFAYGTKAQHDLIEKSMEKSFVRLTSKGAKLAIVIPTPRGLPLTGECSINPTSAGCSQDPKDLLAFAWMKQAYQRLAAKHPGKVTVIAMNDLLCPDFNETTGCPALERNGVLVRKDGVHLGDSQKKWFISNLFARIEVAGFLPE